MEEEEKEVRQLNKPLGCPSRTNHHQNQKLESIALSRPAEEFEEMFREGRRVKLGKYSIKSGILWFHYIPNCKKCVLIACEIFF